MHVRSSRNLLYSLICTSTSLYQYCHPTFPVGSLRPSSPFPNVLPLDPSLLCQSYERPDTQNSLDGRGSAKDRHDSVRLLPRSIVPSPELINIFANTALFLSHIATSDADGLDLASSSAGGYTPLRSFSRASIQTPAEQRPLVNFALSLYSADWFGSYCVHTAVFPFVGNMHIQWFSALRITLYPESTARF